MMAASVRMCEATALPQLAATSGSGEPLVPFPASWSYLPPPPPHQRLGGIAAGGGDGRGRVPRGRRGAPASFLTSFQAGGVGGATRKDAVRVGDLRFWCLCGGVGGYGRRHCSSPPAAPPRHMAGAATGMGRAATPPHFSATSGMGEPPVRLLAFWSYLHHPAPTDNPTSLPQVALTVAGS